MKTLYCMLLCSYFFSACATLKPQIGKRLRTHQVATFSLPDTTIEYAGAPRNFLFLIAAKDYPASKNSQPNQAFWKPLNNPVRDAQAVKKVLMSQYNFTHVYECYNQDFTIANVVRIFKTLKTEANSIDNLIIYYSGHGHQQVKDGTTYGYFVPPNTYQAKDYLSHKQFLGYIEEFGQSFRHVLVISDACFSGTLVMEGKSKGGKGGTRDNSRRGFTAGSMEQVSDGLKGGHSPFARVLIDELKHNSKDFFSVKELSRVVSEKVKKQSGQNPLDRVLLGVPEDDGTFMLYNYQGNEQHLNNLDFWECLRLFSSSWFD